MHCVDYIMCTIKGFKSTRLETVAQRKGKVNEPLLRLLVKNVVPNELHLMLHITDMLTRNLIRAAIKCDTANSCRISVLMSPMVTKLLTAIDNCGVSL